MEMLFNAIHVEAAGNPNDYCHTKSIQVAARVLRALHPNIPHRECLAIILNTLG